MRSYACKVMREIKQTAESAEKFQHSILRCSHFSTEEVRIRRRLRISDEKHMNIIASAAPQQISPLRPPNQIVTVLKSWTSLS